MQRHFSTYIFDFRSASIFPAKMHERVITLIDIYLTFSLICCYRCSIQSHFPCSKFKQMLGGRTAEITEKWGSHLWMNSTLEESEESWVFIHRKPIISPFSSPCILQIPIFYVVFIVFVFLKHRSSRNVNVKIIIFNKF